MNTSFSMIQETSIDSNKNKTVRHIPSLQLIDGKVWHIEKGQNMNITVKREGGIFTVSGVIECVDVENNFILIYPISSNHSQPICIKLDANNPNGVITKNIIEDFSVNILEEDK